MTTKIYALTGLHCGACVKKITQALAPLADGVEVRLSPMQLVLNNPKASFEALQTAVAGAGNYILGPDSASNTTLAQSIQAHAAIENIAKMRAKTTAAEAIPLSWLASYKPLLLIVGYLLGGSLLVQVGMGGAANISAMETMRYFMAGFFLVFSFFKLLDIDAFANAYVGYDLLARRWRGWGLAYPLVELALGIAYLTHFSPVFTLWTTIIVMGISALGVIQAVTRKTQIQCACLGTVFKLPMSTVTIIEDLGMVAMATLMLAVSV